MLEKQNNVEKKEEKLLAVRKKLQQQMEEKKRRDFENKGGYLEGGDEINPAEIEYLYNMMKQEAALKGEGMFTNKGDHVMNMFKHIFRFGKEHYVPT